MSWALHQVGLINRDEVPGFIRLRPAEGPKGFLWDDSGTVLSGGGRLTRCSVALGPDAM